MPRFKDNVSKADERQPVGVYDGPAVPDGTYAGILRSLKLRTAKSGSKYWNALVVLDAKNKEGNHAQYDGAQAWTKFFQGDSDFEETKRLGLWKAICGKGDVTIEVDDKVQGEPVVTKVGGVPPNGTRVYVELRTEDDEWGQSGFMIYPDGSAKVEAAQAETASDEPEGELDIEAEAKPEPEPAKRTRKTAAKKAAPSNVTPINKAAAEDEEADYDSMTLPQIRAAAKEAGLEVSGVPKATLIEQLKAQADGGTDTDGKTSPADIQAMSDDELVEFIEANSEYVGADFLPPAMSRKDTIELLVEEGIITPF